MPRSVLITTSIIVQVPDDDNEGFTFVEPFGYQLREAIERTFRGSEVVEFPSAMTYEWIDFEDMNIGKCVECGCWVSDYAKLELLKGIAAGCSLAGPLRCDACEFSDEGSSRLDP